MLNLFLDSQILQSVDNEAWPFHPKGDELGAFMIIERTRYNIQRFIEGTNRRKYLKSLRKGFRKGWKMILNNSDSTNILNQKEKNLFEKRSRQNPTLLAHEIFSESKDSTIRWWKKGRDWWDTEEGKKFLKQHGIKV